MSKLDFILEELQMTQKDLAEFLNIDPHSLTNHKKKRYDTPNKVNKLINGLFLTLEIANNVFMFKKEVSLDLIESNNLKQYFLSDLTEKELSSLVYECIDTYIKYCVYFRHPSLGVLQ